MADIISEAQVANLHAVLRTDAAIDSKVNQINTVKASIKHHNVPENCIISLFEALRVASSSQHAILVFAGFTALNHLLARLNKQEPKFIVKEAVRALPLIIEKLGDPKEKLQAIAYKALVTMYMAAPLEAERSVRNTAMIGKNPRAKEASLKWLLQVRTFFGIPRWTDDKTDVCADAPGEWSPIPWLRSHPDGAPRGRRWDGSRCCQIHRH